MRGIRRPLRIEPAFDDREAVRALFAKNGPYPSAAAYLPDGSDESDERPADAVLPWFRSTWALGGQPRIAGVEPILHNQRFLEAARTFFGTSRVVPGTVVVNVNAPMPAGVPHVDVPVFRGAGRESLPLRLLLAMGASGLFEPWRIVEAGVISWFYDGPGGHFDAWPEGLDGPMESERPPFGNVAILADSDRMFHRIGAVGPPGAPLPRMTEKAQIAPDAGGGWAISEGSELRARYPPGAVRLSVLWKAEVFLEDEPADQPPALTKARVLEVLREDLRRRAVRLAEPDDALTDPAWVSRVYQLYTRGPRPSDG